MKGPALVDPIATLFVGGLIGFNGTRLLKENFSVLMGRSPGKDFIENVRNRAVSWTK